MSVEKMRAEFEAWYAAELKSIEDKMPPFCVSTLRFSKEVLLEGWKASRESLVIDLPQQSGADLSWNQAIRYCREAIEAAGLKVKI